jgi:hypothetical protein
MMPFFCKIVPADIEDHCTQASFIAAIIESNVEELHFYLVYKSELIPLFF